MNRMLPVVVALVLPTFGLLLALAAEPVPAESKEFLDRDFRKQAEAFIAHTLKESYSRAGKRSPAWDADVRRLFDAAALRTANNGGLTVFTMAKIPDRKEVLALAESVRRAGCDDSLVFALYASHVDSSQWNTEFTKTAVAQLADMQQRKHHPIHVAAAARAIMSSGKGGLRPCLDALAESVAAMARQKEYPGIARRILYLCARTALSRAPGIEDKVYAELEHGKNLDPWLTAMLQGDHEMAEARRVAHPDIVARQIGKVAGDPKPHWQAARRHYEAAWKLYPNNPEPAGQMMRLIEASDRDNEDAVREWFYHAVGAQFDWDPAYLAMRQHLVNKRNFDLMHDFGLECLKTERYDTDVPENYLAALDDIELNTRSDVWWRRPEVRENVREFFRLSREDPTPRRAEFLETAAAYRFYRCGCYAEALAAFERAGERLDKSFFARRALDPATALARCRAEAGPLAAALRAAEEKSAAGQPDKAAQDLQQILAKMDQNDKARSHIRSRLVVAEIEASFATGKWVSIQPPADLAGWTQACGDWSVDAKGGLVGTSDVTKVRPQDLRGAMLLCQAKIGTRFELRGHAEIVKSDPQEGSFGAVIAYASPTQYWKCLFFPPHGTNTAGRAHVSCSIHRNPHSRTARVAQADDFRVQVYDDRVVTTVGNETRAEQGPYAIVLDHDPPTSATSFGISTSRPFFGRPPTVVRFTKLELRKLAEPPAAAKVIEPGANGAAIDR